MFAVLSTAWVVPGLVGPVLAERVADGVGWRWVFLVLVPLVACAGAAVVPATTWMQPCDDLGVALGTGVVGGAVAFGSDIGRAAGPTLAAALVVPTMIALLGMLLSQRIVHAPSPA